MATEFHTLNAQGADILIPQGVSFTTYWMLTGGAPVAMEVNHPWNALDLFGTSDLARFCIRTTTIPDTPAPRADLPKSTVVERLIAIGKVSDVMTALRADDGLYALWFSPDWQNVYKDDERVIPIFQSAGLTTDEISTVMA